MTTAVVVGSGPNGLAAAIRLAQSGLDVVVLERAGRPGGGMRTSESTLPGVLHDDCSAVHPMAVASPFFASLGLDRHGLRWAWPDVDLAHPLDDGRVPLLSRDPLVTAASLGADAARWRGLFEPLARDLDAVLEEVMQPLVHVPRHPAALMRFGAPAVLPATWLARRWHDEPARALFVGCAAHAFGRLDRPLTSSVGLLLASLGRRVGWPVAVGGSEAIAHALLGVLADLGGTVRTGVEVTELAGIADEAGARPDLVLFDTSVTAAVRIAGDRVAPAIARSLGRWRYGPAAFKVDLVVEGGIPWRHPDLARAGTVHLGGTAAEIAGAEAMTARGRMPERPFVLVAQQYLADPSRSSGDLHPIWAYAHVPHGYGGDATTAVLDQIQRWAPGVRDRIVAVAARSPAKLQTHNPNYVGGDIGSGATAGRQFVLRPRPGTRPYRLGEGLYLCSSATPPGPGVHGMGGVHAADAALADMIGP